MGRTCAASGATETAVAVTHDQSLKVTQNILVSLLSELAFVRGIFPTSSFSVSKSGKSQHHLVGKGKSAEADTFLQWLEEGVFSLLKTEKLTMLVLTLAELGDNPSKFTEAWYFRFEATGVDGEVEVQSNGGKKTKILVGRTQSQVKKMFTSLMKTVASLGSALQPLPDEYNISMRLAFQDDPENPGFQPPHFEDAKESGQGRMCYRKKPEVLDIGQSATPFHSLTLKVKTVVDDDDAIENNDYNFQETYAEPNWENETDEMWRDSDDDEKEDPDDGGRTTPRMQAGMSGRRGDNSMEVDGDQIVTDELVFACACHLSQLRAQDRVTSATLLSKLYCSDTQADCLIDKMVDDGVLIPCGSAFAPGITLFRVATPAKDNSSQATVDADMPAYSVPDDYVVRTTRQRLYGGGPEDEHISEISRPSSISPEQERKKLANTHTPEPSSSNDGACTTPMSLSRAIRAVKQAEGGSPPPPPRKDGISRLAEMFGEVRVRECALSSSKAGTQTMSALPELTPSPRSAPRAAGQKTRPARYGPRSGQTQSLVQAITAAVMQPSRPIQKATKTKG